jgi:hypothetical protein
MRWTVSDIALSPDQRYLVSLLFSSILSPGFDVKLLYLVVWNLHIT